MTSNNIYYFIQNITPPFIFKLIKNSKLYKSSKNSIKKMTSSEYTPKSNTIDVGFLKGYKLFLDPKGEWQSQMLNGTYDSFLFDYIAKLDLKNKTIFDIGTHIGYHSLYFSKLVGEKGKVYAFEPNTFNIERIKINLKENEQVKNIHLKEVALSDRIGTEDFLFSNDIENGTSSGGFLDSSDTIWQKGVYTNEIGFKKIAVKAVTLDSLIDENKNNNPSLLKIDVEGAENLVLKGGISFINTFHPIILIEVHSMYNMFEVLNILNELSYKTILLKKESDGRCFLACVFNNYQ